MTKDSARKKVHPAFEFRKNLVVVSFRESFIEGTKVKERIVRVFRTTRGKTGLEERDERNSANLRIGTRNYVVDQRYANPPYLEDQWDRDDIDDFLETRSAPESASLYAKLRKAIERHVDLAEAGAYVILSLFAVLSFVYPAFAAVAFLLLLGPKNTGKSQTLDTLAQLCRCGHKSRPSPTVLGDLIEGQRAIPIIDQANQLNPELRQIAIDSYRSRAARTVTDVENRARPHRFETFGPKVFAAHRSFDADLADRCIQINMAPATREVEPILADDDRLHRLRWQLYRFTLLNFRDLFRIMERLKRKEVGNNLGLKARELELWWPYEVLFEWLSVPQEDRDAAREFYKASLPSTKAELDEGVATLMRALYRLSGEATEAFEVQSDEVASEMRQIAETGFREHWIGTELKAQGLVLAKRRERTNGRKVTVYRINTERLRDRLRAWNLLESEEDS